MQEQPIMGVIMDPIDTIKTYKDSTFALLKEAHRQGFVLYYMTVESLFLEYGVAFANTQALSLLDGDAWYALSKPTKKRLDEFDVLFMRKDPPITLNYFYATQILEHAESNGVLVVNKPQSLRDANEKLFATWFPQCMPPTLVSTSKKQIKAFIEEHIAVILKPLDSMGGHNIFKCTLGDPNINTIIDLLTHYGKEYMMAQQFIHDISEGDKRILLINGDPVPYALARIPATDDFRGNLAMGATAEGRPLTERDQWICEQIGPVLREKGLSFVGIDVIGDYLTEINVTSPTGIQEIEKFSQIPVAKIMIDYILDTLRESSE